MEKSVNLTRDEQLALEMLKATGEIQKIARRDGTINLADIGNYFQELVRHLEFSQKRRRGDYIDVIPVPQQEEVA